MSPSVLSVSFRDRPDAVLVSVSAVLAPSLALFSALAMAPLLSILAVGLLACGNWRHFPPRVLTRGQGLALAALVLWILAACFRSIVSPGFAMTSLAMMLGTVLAGLVAVDGVRRLDEAGLRLALAALAAGVALAVLILLVCGGLDRTVFDNDARYYRFFVKMDRGATVVALLIWPACLGLRRAGAARAAALLLLMAFPALLLSCSLSAKVALLVSSAAALLVWGMRRRALAVLGAGVLGVLLLAPLWASHLPDPHESITWPGLPMSVHHRMTIWSYAAGRIAEHPLAGWGMEASREIAGKTALSVPRPDGAVYVEPLMPLHPHNAAIQIWLELGGVGAALLAGFLAATLWRLAGPANLVPGSPGEVRLRAHQAAGFVAGAVVAAVSFGFWQSWWQCSLWLCAAFLVAQNRRG